MQAIIHNKKIVLNDTPYEKALLKFINGDEMTKEALQKVADKFGKTVAQVKKDINKMDEEMYSPF